jgi:ribosome-binding factor A
MSRPKERSQRQLRVGQEIRRILAEIVIREGFLDEANFQQSVTITEVQVSPDLKNATAFVMPLGGVNSDELIEDLTKQIHYYRSVIAKQLKTKYIPNLYFKIDTTFDQAEKISRLLNQPRVKRDIETKDDEE